MKEDAEIGYRFNFQGGWNRHFNIDSRFHSEAINKEEYARDIDSGRGDYSLYSCYPADRTIVCQCQDSI